MIPRTFGIPRVAAAALALATAVPALTLHGQSSGARGLELARELGCGACHSGLPAPDAARRRAPVFGPGGTPVPAAFVAEYLADPRPRRPDIAPSRMPDFRLREDERLALGLYLGAEGDEGLPDLRARHRGITAADGGLLFRGLGCAGCHGDPEAGDGSDESGSSQGVGPDLARAGARYNPSWVEGFLSHPVQVRPAGHRPGTGSRMPDFRLTPEESADLTAYLAGLGRDAPEARATTRRGSSTEWGRDRAGVYLADRLSCLGCHGWRGEGGRVAPPLDGLGQRLTSGAIAAMIHDPDATRPGSLMPASPFRREILDRVAGLLAEDTEPWAPADPPAIGWDERRAFLAGAASRGETQRDGTVPGRDLYLATCAQCHGSKGDGGGFNAAYLPVVPTAHADAGAMSRRPDDTLHDGIAAGGWVLDRNHRMPAFGRKLSPSQIRSLVAYIRDLCGCAAPGWSRGDAS